MTVGDCSGDPKLPGLGDEGHDDDTSLPSADVATAEVSSPLDHLTLDLLRKLAPHLR